MSNNLARGLHRIGFTVKKHSPELCTIAGIGGMIVATVMACKATTKLDDILSEAKDTIDTINECSTNPDALPAGAEYSKEDAKKDLVVTYTKTGLKVFKLYGPSLAVGVLSITSIVASNVILKKRNIGLAAAYTAIDKSFKDYRGRVVDKFGEEIDKQLKYGVKAVEIEKEIALDEKVQEILDAQEEEIEYLNADRRQLFWMTKKRLANDFGVILNNEDRFSDIAHKILDYLWEEDFIHYVCSDNQVKNIIFNSLDDFIKGFEKADSEVLTKLRNYKRKLIPGTEDYDLVYHRLYEEELIKRGLI